MSTKSSILFILLGLIIISCNTKDEADFGQSTPRVEKSKSSIYFQTTGELGDAKLLLFNGDQSYPIKTLESPNLMDLEPSEYHKYDIPQSATSGVSFFYAGLLDVFYVILSENNSAKVYSASRDEMETHPLEYKLIKEVHFSKQMSNKQHDDFYIINTAAVKDENDAIKKKNDLQLEGYKAGYLWIPDYESLSGAEYFSVFIGPFDTKQECAIAVDQYRVTDPKAYGTLVSHKTERITVGGLNEAN